MLTFVSIDKIETAFNKASNVGPCFCFLSLAYAFVSGRVCMLLSTLQAAFYSFLNSNLVYSIEIAFLL